MRAILFFLTICLTSSSAFAHAMLEHASPAVGSEVSAPPPALALTYSEPVEPTFSHVQVTNGSGSRMDNGQQATAQDGHVLSIGLKPLPPGIYNVEWHVTSVDTHKTEGHFIFTVKP